MSDARARPHRRLVPARAVATVGALVAAGWTAALIWVTQPRHAVCPAIYPAPPGCSDRTGTAGLWVAAVWAALAIAIVILRLRGRRLSGAIAALALVVLVGAVGYRVVLYGTAPLGFS